MLSQILRLLALMALGSSLLPLSTLAAPSLSPRSDHVPTIDQNIILKGFLTAHESISETGLAARQRIIDDNPDMPDKELYVVYSYSPAKGSTNFLIAALPPADPTMEDMIKKSLFVFTTTLTADGHARLGLEQVFNLRWMEKEPPMSLLSAEGYVWFGKTFKDVTAKVDGVGLASVHSDVMSMLRELKEGWVEF
ncbi:MAG: hypothetical protein M1829_003845 [Trizodia sp. TS-e1964]|nr:MAG: hypothetical protein M1829_003845 [Trizodia sp. TS-e1964]